MFNFKKEERKWFILSTIFILKNKEKDLASRNKLNFKVEIQLIARQEVQWTWKEIWRSLPKRRLAVMVIFQRRPIKHFLDQLKWERERPMNERTQESAKAAQGNGISGFLSVRIGSERWKTNSSNMIFINISRLSN